MRLLKKTNEERLGIELMSKQLSLGEARTWLQVVREGAGASGSPSPACLSLFLVDTEKEPQLLED